VIISIVTGVTVLSFNTDNSPRELDREARRLFQVLRLLSDEAVLQNKEFGLEIYEDGYSFLQFEFDNNEWLEFDDLELFRAYLIPESMRLVLYSQDIPFELGQQSESASQSSPDFDEQDGLSENNQNQNDQSQTEQNNKKPSVWFLSSGEVTPFELEFSLQENNIDPYKISVNDLGQLILEDPYDE